MCALSHPIATIKDLWAARRNTYHRYEFPLKPLYLETDYCQRLREHFKDTLDGIDLDQLPGHQLFTMCKRYLQLTPRPLRRGRTHPARAPRARPARGPFGLAFRATFRHCSLKSTDGRESPALKPAQAQSGGVLKWLAEYRDEHGTHRAKTLGTVSGMTKAHAEAELDKLVRPINERRGTTPYTVAGFTQQVALPLCHRKWKASFYQSGITVWPRF